MPEEAETCINFDMDSGSGAKIPNWPPPVQPLYPQVGIDIQPDMANVYIVLGPLTTITQGIPASVMDDIVTRWQARLDTHEP